MERPGLPPLPAVDPRLGVHPVYFLVPRAEANYAKSILESYEYFGVVRAQEPDCGDGRALVVFLLVPDFAGPAQALLAELASAIDLEFPPISPSWIDALLEDLSLEGGKQAVTGGTPQLARRNT
jgi:hypothetical protein